MPAYNEEKRIADVLTRARLHVDLVIVCDDGSDDETSEIAASLGARVVKHDTNRGYGAALRTLFGCALETGADYIVTIDADGQHNPDDIPVLLEPLRQGVFDMVIGSRFLGDGAKFTPLWRKLGIEIINKVSMDGHISDTQSGFRAYTRQAILSLNLCDVGMGVSTEILLQVKEKRFRVGEVPTLIRYYEDSSTLNPFLQGLSVIYSTVRHVVATNPVSLVIVPSYLSLFFLYISAVVLDGFSFTRLMYFSNPLSRILHYLAFYAMALGG
jgi:glycosyltransferase involved in cell wall biosynthesis